MLLELADAQETHVNVDCQEVANFSRACARLYEQLLKYPQEVSPAALRPALPRPALPRPALPCPAPPRPALPRPALPCHVARV